MQWFDVDKQGLAKLLERKGIVFVLLELIQNAWDTLAKKVVVTLEPIPGIPMSKITVEDDDPNGFTHLSHAFTLFAESVKKADATKRGRFNLGEKLVLALCQEATIESTTGTVLFNHDGRHEKRSKREFGSRFCGVIRMTREQHAEALVAVRTLIPPEGVETIVNGEVLQHREPIATMEASLATEIADAEGVLRRAVRKTEVRVYDPLPDETPSVYELGIPVVETGDRWHIDVGQKVPLNLDRDNLPPAYLRQLRVLVLNELHNKLSHADANATWVRDAGSDKDASPEATKKIMDLRFGEKRVSFDPNDPEANSLAASKGYTVVHGGMLNSQEWMNAKNAGAIMPSSQVTPSPKPFSQDGTPLKMVPEEKWTEGMKKVATFCKRASRDTINRESLTVEFTNDFAWPFSAVYGKAHLIFNVGRLGYAFFNKGITEEVLKLIIHELGHEYGTDHLGEDYHDGLCKVGAAIALLAVKKPEWFE